MHVMPTSSLSAGLYIHQLPTSRSWLGCMDQKWLSKAGTLELIGQWPGRKALLTERSRPNVSDPKGPSSKTQENFDSRPMSTHFHRGACVRTHTHSREGKERETSQERGHSKAQLLFLLGSRMGEWDTNVTGIAIGSCTLFQGNPALHQ